MVENDGREYLRFDCGREAEIPTEGTREDLVREAHEKLEHRGLEAVYYEMKERLYWPGMKETIAEVIRRCETCQINNRKKMGGCEFVRTTRVLEKVALDIMDTGERYALIAIDYFWRELKGAVMRSKSAREVVERVGGWYGDWRRPEDVVTDNEMVFGGWEFARMCDELGMRQRRVSVESHGSNGRVERVIGTIRECLVKDRNGKMAERMKKGDRCVQQDVSCWDQVHAYGGVRGQG